MSDDLTIAAQNIQTPAQSSRPLAFGRGWLPTLLLLVVFAIAWEGFKTLFNIPDQKLPHLFTIFSEFGVRTQGGNGPTLAVTMLKNAAVTFGEALLGFTLGGLLGCALAVLFASSRLLERGLLPFVVGSQTVPILAIAPMVVVGLGRLGAPDLISKAVVAAYLTFFPVTIGMLRGLRSVPPDALALMRSYAATGGQTFWKLRLPAALPYLFTSFKVAATASVIGAIVAELPAGSKSGIGVTIINAAQYYNSRPPVLYAAVLVAGLIGLVFYGAVALAERLIIRERKAE
ncbi:MAG: ABC transporter permease [Chloroflexi bacterium SZAS-1]|nr:ABC transporter permease [Chloroflexi bacterium SZAS-1]HNP88267.1 ABC transporter permease [Kouleothrix sp.]